MEQLYLNIAERLDAVLPELTLIDEDYGQLQLSEGQDSYPVTFPCALVDFLPADFSQNRNGDTSLRGRGGVIVKLAFDCYEDTHYSAGTTGAIHARMEMAQRVRRALHRYSFGDDLSPLQLTQTRDYSLDGGIKVYEATFAVNVTEVLAPIEEA